MKVPKRIREIELSGIDSKANFMVWIDLCREAIIGKGYLPKENIAAESFSSIGPALFGVVAMAAVEQSIKDKWLPERKREDFRRRSFNINISAQVETAKILSCNLMLLDLEKNVPTAPNTEHWQALQKWWNDSYENGIDRFEALRLVAIEHLQRLLEELSVFQTRKGQGAGRPAGALNSFTYYPDLVFLADLERRGLFLNGSLADGVLWNNVSDYVSRGLFWTHNSYGDKPSDLIQQHYVRIKNKLDLDFK